MGVRVTGLGKVLANLARTEAKVQAGSLAALRESAKEIRDLARLNAPVDTGDLEKAIVTIEVRERTALGRFGQTTIEVGVDPSKLNLEEHGGFDYSIPMHEGVYNLGPKSEAKQSGQAEQVGPKYLERALKALQAKIRRNMEDAVRRAAK